MLGISLLFVWLTAFCYCEEIQHNRQNEARLGEGNWVFSYLSNSVTMNMWLKEERNYGWSNSKSAKITLFAHVTTSDRQTMSLPRCIQTKRKGTLPTESNPSQSLYFVIMGGIRKINGNWGLPIAGPLLLKWGMHFVCILLNCLIITDMGWLSILCQFLFHFPSDRLSCVLPLGWLG